MGWQDDTLVDDTKKKSAWQADPIVAPKGKAPKDDLSLNPITNARDLLAGAGQQLRTGVSELNPFNPARHEKDAPWYKGLQETGKGLRDVGLGIAGVASTPFAAAGKELGNIYERTASSVVPGQKLFRSEDFQTAAQAVMPGKAKVAAEIAAPSALEGRIAKIAATGKPAQPAPEGVELPIQREGTAPPPASPAAPAWKSDPLVEAKPTVAMAKPEATPPPGLSVVKGEGKSAMFDGADKFKVMDADGKHMTTIFAKQEGDDIRIKGVGGGASGMTEKNAFGSSKMREILPKLQEHFPDAKTISGLRDTGARAKSAADKGKLSTAETKIKLRPLQSKEEQPLRSSTDLGSIGPEAPPAGESRGVPPARPFSSVGGAAPKPQSIEEQLNAWNHAPHEITQEPIDQPQILRKLGPVQKEVTTPKKKAPIKQPKFQGSVPEFQKKMALAKEQGYDVATTYYHGTGADFDTFTQPYGSEAAVFLTDDPHVASMYADQGSTYTPNVIPLLLKKGKSKTVDWKIATKVNYYDSSYMKNLLNKAKSEGYDTVFIKNIYDIGSNGAVQNQVAVLNPVGRLRAKFGAAFDPKQAASGHMLSAAPSGYPELSTAGHSGAQAILQQRLGLGERATTKAITALEPFQAQLNASPRSERLKVIDYMENRSHGNTSIDPKYQAAADEMRRVYKDIEYRLGGTHSTEDMGFIEDYFRHQVKDPKKVTSFMSAWKEGSAKGATKKRSFPTVSDLLEAGHELVNDNPVEVTMDYAYHMNKFTATTEAFDIAKSQGTIKMMAPSRVPEGYLPIEGRHGGLNQHGQAAYAPAEFAKPWNAFVSQGFSGTFGDIVKGTRAITNATTAVKLMSGYHFATMGAASFSSELARAFDNIGYGRPAAAARALGGAASVIGPAIRQFKTGLRGQKVYAGGVGSPEESKVIDYLTQANFRPSKIDRSISVTQTGNLYTAWKRGALSHQLRSQMADVAAARGVMKAAPIARGVWSLFGRSIDTIMAPLFEKTIPALKTGAAMESLRDYLIARPAATFEEIMTEARNVQRNMDDRFGEMNHDNLFWNQKLKEGLQASMLSYSWNVGIGRALGGGGKDIVAALGAKATQGKFGSAGWTRRASYALAFPIGAAYLSAVYQALKTAQAPRGPQDLLAARTGGVNPATQYRRESDERIAIPGHMKDVFEMRDLYTGDKTPWEIAANKLNPMLRTAGDMISGHDWRGHRISDPEANTQTKLKQYLAYAAQGTVEPIFMSQLGQKKEGSNINLFETILGIHPAPDFLQDPSGHGDMMRAKANKDYVATLSALKSEAIRRGDQARADAFQQDIHRRQQQMKRIQP